MGRSFSTQMKRFFVWQEKVDQDVKLKLQREVMIEAYVTRQQIIYSSISKNVF